MNVIQRVILTISLFAVLFMSWNYSMDLKMESPNLPFGLDSPFGQATHSFSEVRTIDEDIFSSWYENNVLESQLGDKFVLTPMNPSSNEPFDLQISVKDSWVFNKGLIILPPNKITLFTLGNDYRKGYKSGFLDAKILDLIIPPHSEIEVLIQTCSNIYDDDGDVVDIDCNNKWQSKKIKSKTEGIACKQSVNGIEIADSNGDFPSDCVPGNKYMVNFDESFEDESSFENYEGFIKTGTGWMSVLKDMDTLTHSGNRGIAASFSPINRQEAVLKIPNIDIPKDGRLSFYAVKGNNVPISASNYPIKDNEYPVSIQVSLFSSGKRLDSKLFEPSLNWQEFEFDVSSFAGKKADIILTAIASMPEFSISEKRLWSRAGSVITFHGLFLDDIQIEGYFPVECDVKSNLVSDSCKKRGFNDYSIMYACNGGLLSIDESLCEFGCKDGFCLSSEDLVCDDSYVPVCANSITFDNSCKAKKQGFNTFKFGVCSNEDSSIETELAAQKKLNSILSFEDLGVSTTSVKYANVNLKSKTPVNVVKGVLGDAIELNNQRLQSENTNLWSDDEQFSVEFWVKSDNPASPNAYIVGKRATDSQSGNWVVRYNADAKLAFTVYGNSDSLTIDDRHMLNAVADGSFIDDGKWHYVVGNRGRSRGSPAGAWVELYVDGKKVAQKQRIGRQLFWTHNGKIHLGGSSNQNMQTFSGVIDELKVSEPLSKDVIKNNYETVFSASTQSEFISLPISSINSDILVGKYFVNGCNFVIGNGPSSDKLDVLFVGDGYSDDNALNRDVLRLLDWSDDPEEVPGQFKGAFMMEPFKSNKEKFNIWMLKTPALGVGSNVQNIINQYCPQADKVYVINTFRDGDVQACGFNQTPPICFLYLKSYNTNGYLSSYATLSSNYIFGRLMGLESDSGGLMGGPDGDIFGPFPNQTFLNEQLSQYTDEVSKPDCGFKDYDCS